MDAPSSSLQSDATSAPQGQSEPVTQVNAQDNRTAEEKEQAAMQERFNALPMLKVLSIMRKALPGDAHIDADVDEVIKACIARFFGVLVKEAKRQESLARHHTMQSEDIVNAFKHLGFEDSVTALSLFLSRFRGDTCPFQPRQEQLPVLATRRLPTEVQRQRYNQGDIQYGRGNSSHQHKGNATVFPLPSQEMPAWHSSYAHPFSLQTLQGRIAWDVPSPQPVPNPCTASWMNIFLPAAPQQGPIQGYEQQVPTRMMQPQWNTEGYAPNMQVFGAPPFPQHVRQPYPQHLQMQLMSQQQHVGGFGTTMRTDGILSTGAGSSTSAANFFQEMAHMDPANALQSIRQYEERPDLR